MSYPTPPNSTKYADADTLADFYNLYGLMIQLLEHRDIFPWLCGKFDGLLRSTKRTVTDVYREADVMYQGVTGETLAQAKAALKPVQIVDSKASPMEALALAAHGRSAPVQKCVSWAARNAAIPFEEIDPDTVPDPAAVFLLTMAKAGDAQFTSVYAKLIPNRQTIEAEERKKDSNIKIEDLVREIQRAKPVDVDQEAVQDKEGTSAE